MPRTCRPNVSAVSAATPTPRKRVVSASSSAHFAVVSVVDFGIGIPPEELGRIFRRCHRVSSSLVHDVKGSGLGLALVKHVVEAHGGRVTVASRPGQGSTFTISLPIEARAQEVARASCGVEEMGAATYRGAR